MAAEDPNFSSHIPLKILSTATTKDAGYILDLLEKMPFASGGSVTAMNFAVDFDFQQAADGFTALYLLVNPIDGAPFSERVAEK